MTEVQRPPLTADERVQLIGWLDLQRSFVRMKCEGLGEEDAHRKVLQTSPLMTMAGLAALRYILCHMIEETARHVGHMDIIRELLDGKTGYTTMSQA